MVGKPHHHSKPLTLASKGDKSVFEKVLNAAKKAYAYLHTQGRYEAKNIAEYENLINATNKVFTSALSKGIKDNVIPSRMMTSLENDVFVFSALKTHAQLFEASRQLLTDEGKVKSFQQFSQDVEKIKKDYNQNYLRAEYNFAVSSAQQAANWARIEESGDRYNLQYRTAGDDRVRDDHEALNGTTLPPSDPFWNSYYPPNGWNCRCVAVEVLKEKYPESDSEKAVKKGEAATMQIGKDGKNRMEIFRFNPGKEKVIFPPNHPYYPKGCGGDMSKLKGMPGIYLAANKGNCGVKKIAQELFEKRQKIRRKTADNIVKSWTQKTILEQGEYRENSYFETKKVFVTRSSLRSISDHFKDPELKVMARDILSIKKFKKINNEIVKLDPKSHNYEKKKQDGVKGYNYYLFKWKGDHFTLNLEVMSGYERIKSVNQWKKKES